MAFLLGSLVLAATGVRASGSNFPDCSNGPLASNDVCNTKLSITERAQALVDAIELEEKYALLINTSPGVPRLGLPSYEWWSEALHGVASSPGVTFAEKGNFSYASSFPEPILMSAAFDDDLIEAVATVVSTEARAFNNFNRSGLDYWTPNINPYRDPRWGRGMETPGEDPFRISSYVKSLIKGLQGGEDPDILKVAATCKHFAGYDIEDWMGNERYGNDVHIDAQELAEYFMQPFMACVDANVASVMCSYNALNGVPTCSSSYIIQDLLRDHWGWNRDYQYVTSDCDSIQNIYKPHNYRDTRSASAASALLAGTDLDCGTYYELHLPTAYEEGIITNSTIDQALVRLYSALVKLGYFDPADATPYRSLDWSDVFTAHAEELVRKAAEESLVLIKNDGTLPLQIPSEGNLTIAMIGQWANATDEMQGNYLGTAKYLHSPYWAASQTPNVHAIYGGVPGDPTTDGYPAALSAAAAADVVIYADGPNTSDESEERDRNLIGWSGERVDVMTQLAGLGKPFVLLQMGDQQDDAPFLRNPNVSAILWAGYPGQAGGDAILNVLTGRVAPAGRLPVTQYPGDYVGAVAMTDMGLRPNASTGSPGRTYMWYDNATVPFGFGLHYTEFRAAIQPPRAGANDSSGGAWDTRALADKCGGGGDLDCTVARVPVAVANTGRVASDFVALGFLAGEHGPEPYPRKRLVAFRRLFDVQPGQSRTASLDLTLRSLGRHDESGNFVLYPGSYRLEVDVPEQDSWEFEVRGDEVRLDSWPQDTGA
ncbi:beta-glucosidase [Xylariomycetidae sp. FL0641]|nr:beta-glucosidase [Xylariomycetidae sp. FL0641]